MLIVTQAAPHLSTHLSPRLLLPAPKRPPIVGLLSAPKIAGYLPASHPLTTGRDIEQPLQRANHTAIVPKKRVVVAEIVNPLDLIDFRRDPKAWWAEFERIHGPDKTIEELDAEIEAKHPGYLAWLARQKQREAARS